MEGTLVAPPVLSTPESHLFEDPTPLSKTSFSERLTDDDVRNIYEVGRTAAEIQTGGWTRVALQFPDNMLNDAPRVFQFLEEALGDLRSNTRKASTNVEDVTRAVQE